MADASGRLDLDAFREPRWPIEHVPPALRAEMDRLAARVAALEGGIRQHRHEMRARDAFWVDKAHRGTPGQSINEHLWALLDDRTETT